MELHERQRDQIEMWLHLASDLAERISEKEEEEITKKDIIKIAQKIEDIMNVFYGKSKIAGWRFEK